MTRSELSTELYVSPQRRQYRSNKYCSVDLLADRGVVVIRLLALQY